MIDTKLFREFFNSEKSGGIVLIACTIASLLLTNIFIKLNLSLEHWINDGLMTVFFLLIGLEIERELYEGELSNIRNALLPLAAAVGGMLLPALIHF